MRSRIRHEVASAGLDDFLAGLGGHWTGLRIPTAAIGTQSGLPIDYLFLLHVVDLVPGDQIDGLAQLLTIAAPQLESERSTRVYPFELQVRTPIWHAPDSFHEWILTEDRTPPSGGSQGGAIAGPADSDSFVFEDCQTPALVYETVHFPAVPLAPGYLGLDDYTPPAVRGSIVLLARDLRWPWEDYQSFPSLRLPVTTASRFRFYLRIRQTSAQTRQRLNIDPTAWQKFPASFTPEDGLMVASQGGGAVLAEDTLQYWRCGGRILYQSGKDLRAFEPGEAVAAPAC